MYVGTCSNLKLLKCKGKEEVGSCGYIFLQLAYTYLHTQFITTFLWLNQQYDATTILELFQTNPHFIINLVFLSLPQRNLTYYYFEQKSNNVPTLLCKKNLQSILNIVLAKNIIQGIAYVSRLCSYSQTLYHMSILKLQDAKILK